MRYTIIKEDSLRQSMVRYKESNDARRELFEALLSSSTKEAYLQKVRGFDQVMTSQRTGKAWHATPEGQFRYELKRGRIRLEGIEDLTHEDDAWSLEELREAVIAYIEMWQKSRRGERINKKSYYDDLSRRFGRSAKAFERRMQNISYVLSLQGRGWLSGLLPAKHVGSNVTKTLEELLAEVEGRAAHVSAAFEAEVKESLFKKAMVKPDGNANPTTATSTTSQFIRDPKVKAWVLREANGVCELCHQAAPFKGSDGLPFLEVHHLRLLANGGSDTVSNAIALCPNCHRELHFGESAADKLESLYLTLPRLNKE